MKKLILSSMIALAVILSGTAVSSAVTASHCAIFIKLALDSDDGFKNTREGLRRYSDIISLGGQEVEVQAFTFISKTTNEVLTLFCQGGVFVGCDATPGVGAPFDVACSSL